jgi:hypothetical protein
MKKILNLSIAGAALAAAALCTVPSAAHHSFSTEFDSAKPLVLEGTVTRARLVNPHSWIYVDVKNSDGSVTNWGLEFSTPLALKQHGISRNDVAFGTKLRLAGFRAKNGGPFGYAAAVVFPDGRQVKTGGAPDEPTPALH